MAKIRYGFVSNSSSSSFILPVKDANEKVNITVKYSDIIKYISSNSDNSIVSIRNEQELYSYYLEEWDYKYDKYKEEDINYYVKIEYEKALKLIKEKKVVYMGNIDYSDTLIRMIFENIGVELD